MEDTTVQTEATKWVVRKHDPVCRCRLNCYACKCQYEKSGYIGNELREIIMLLVVAQSVQFSQRQWYVTASGAAIQLASMMKDEMKLCVKMTKILPYARFAQRKTGIRRDCIPGRLHTSATTMKLGFPCVVCRAMETPNAQVV